MRKYWLSGVGLRRRPGGGGRRDAQIKIGVAGPITGPNAAFGAQLTKGRAGGRGHQQGRRHPRPEDHGRAGRRRVRSEARRLGRQQVRRRRRQVRRRPLQLRRHDPGLRRLLGERHPVHHALGDQSRRSPTASCGTRSAPAAATTSRACVWAELRPRQAQGQEDRRRPRQDHLRQGPRRRARSTTCTSSASRKCSTKA